MPPNVTPPVHEDVVASVNGQHRHLEVRQQRNCITEMFRWSHGEHGRAVFVAKFIPDYDPD
jgi:hypothetical protein